MKIGEGKHNIERRKYQLHGCKIFSCTIRPLPFPSELVSNDQCQSECYHSQGPRSRKGGGGNISKILKSS